MVLTLQYIPDGSDSMEEALGILKGASGKKVCYVTLNKSCGALQEFFKKGGGNVSDVYYIDGISSTIGDPKVVDNCSYVKTPYDLDPIALEIKKAIVAGSSLVVFDSISNLLAYGSSAPAGTNLLVNFINSFAGDLKANNGDAIFLVKKGDAKKFLVEETLSTFDNVIGGEK